MSKSDRPQHQNHESRSGIGLALSGGGARGLAHVGVLLTLEQSGIPISCLAGSSMGGIIAAIYSAGWDATTMKAEALRLSEIRQLIKLVDIGPPRRGLLAGQKVREYLAQFIDPDLTFSDLKIPLALKAADINTGRQVDLTSGNLLEAVLATSAFPGVFPHVKIGDHQLIDGGVLNNVPLDMLDNLGAQRRVAVDVTPRYSGDQSTQSLPVLEHLPALAQDVYRTVVLMIHALAAARIDQQPPDVLITPDVPLDIGIFTGFPRAEEIIQAGQDASQQELTAIKRLIPELA